MWMFTRGSGFVSRMLLGPQRVAAWAGRDSNPQEALRPGAFKTPASAVPPPARGTASAEYRPGGKRLSRALSPREDPPAVDERPSREPAPPPLPAAPRRGDAWIAFFLAFLALSAFAWVRDLWDADEGRYAAVALDMLRTGDFVTPREDHMRFLDKPPLVYWAEDAAFTIFGATPFSARLPCLLSGAAMAAFVFLLAAAWTGDRAKSGCAAGI